MYKQNSLITRYWAAVAVMLALLGPLAQKGRCNFTLYDNQQFTVNSYHSTGNLYDTSRAFIISRGYVNSMYAYNSSKVDVSGGSVGRLEAHNLSDVNVPGGSVTELIAFDSSKVDISGGSVGILNAQQSTVNISSGYVDGMTTYSSSIVNISGGSVSWFNVGAPGPMSSTVNIYNGSVYYIDIVNTSVMNISGGYVGTLRAQESSTVTFYGRNFLVSGGLTLDGERVLGTTGILSGEWMDGTPWVVSIEGTEPTATILAIIQLPPVYCEEPIPADLNGDCKVDFADFAIMASSWLECNLVPQSACWE